MVAFVSLKELMHGISYQTLLGIRKNKITGVTCDTNKITEGCAYVCIRGTMQDGHQFAAEAIKQGARVIVVEHFCPMLQKMVEEAVAESARPTKRIVVLLVADTRRAYAQMSRNFFGRPDEGLTMIGITGTKGKTSTSYLLHELLSTKYRTGRIGTNGAWLEGEYRALGHTTPDAYELYELLYHMKKRGITHVVMEVSSQGLKQHRVEGISFYLGIYTNCYRDHIGANEHASMEEYAYWKSVLSEKSELFLVNADDETAMECGRKHSDCYQYSAKSGNMLGKISVKWEDIPKDTAFGAWMLLSESGKRKKALHRYYIPGAYDFYRENILSSLSAASLCGIDVVAHAQCLAQVRIPGRMQMVYASAQLHILIDYAHNEISLKRVLMSLKSYHPKRLICLFGCGGDRSRERRFLMGEVSARYADLTIITEDNSRSEKVEDIIGDILVGAKRAGGDYIVIPDRTKAIAFAIQNYQEGDFLLLSGKGHEQYMQGNTGKTVFSEVALVEQELIRLGIRK